MKKLILISFLLLLVIIVFSVDGFIKKPTLEEQREIVISELNLAIEGAKESGVYKCCIEPACTMCYLNGNKWNYGKAGTCACDEFIARGEDPCPQCIKGIEEGLCKSTKKEECDTESGTIFKSILNT